MGRGIVGYVISQASVQQRQKSVESIGVIQDVRGGAWLQQAADVNSRKYLSLHWATLLQGAERAYKADPQRKNSNVQTSVAQGLRRAKAIFIVLVVCYH